MLLIIKSIYKLNHGCLFQIKAKDKTNLFLKLFVKGN